MAQQKIQIQKEVYNKGLLNDTINTQFTQLVQGINREAELRASIETVDEFFRLYDLLFFDIPKEGAVNSHQYIIQESTDYVGSQQDNEAIQALLDEIASIRQENLNLRQQLADQGLTPATGSQARSYNDFNSLIIGTPLTSQAYPNNNTSATPGLVNTSGTSTGTGTTELGDTNPGGPPPTT